MTAPVKHYSLESLLKWFVTAIFLLVLALLGVIFYLTQASLLLIITVFIVVFVPLALLCRHVLNEIRLPFLGLSAALEAVRHEDYSLRASPKFTAGAVKMLNDEVTAMSNDLRIRKLHYDQQAVLVLNLIQQLSTPIAVFDQSYRLRHANDAFSQWSAKPWKQAKYAKAATFGLHSPDQISAHWRFADTNANNEWQLRFSQFSMQGDLYHLVVLTNIAQLVHQTEQTAWHKMTRVLSHEINNSLSPIKSLAQSLVDVFSRQQLDAASIEALTVIASRSDNLMQFVNRYASLTQQFNVNIELVPIKPLLDKVTTLFEHDFVFQDCDISVMADPVLLEQVLINLIKNAIEATNDKAGVTLRCQSSQSQALLIIQDNGPGIANPDNLFVPFYTTKENGKGIGLALSRNMIEQQGGKLQLRNKAIGQGAEAIISLPVS